MFADYHVHTEFSGDSAYPMEQVVQDAVAMRMDEICFTDHVDYGIKDDWESGKPLRYRGEEVLANVDYPVYAAKIKELQQRYRALGGEIITIGSDSHSPKHLGTYIAEARQLLKGLGFRYFCTYDRMQPIYHGLLRYSSARPKW